MKITYKVKKNPLIQSLNIVRTNVVIIDKGIASNRRKRRPTAAEESPGDTRRILE